MMDDEALTRLRADLEAHRENLRKEILEEGADPDSDDVAIDLQRNFADSGHSTEERAQVISVVRALRGNLHWVDRALAKMDRGEYGACERCGKPISPERLEALPWAILCIDCMREGAR
jgi:RNA polymerase-binding transcription factor